MGVGWAHLMRLTNGDDNPSVVNIGRMYNRVEAIVFAFFIFIKISQILCQSSSLKPPISNGEINFIPRGYLQYLTYKTLMMNIHKKSFFQQIFINPKL
jgi:hypothetical protein